MTPDYLQQASGIKENLFGDDFLEGENDVIIIEDEF